MPGKGQSRLAELSLRPATDADWSLIWPIFSEVVTAGDTYTYDPATDYERGRELWLGSGACWLATDGPGGAVLGSYKVGPNRAGPGAHIGTASYLVDAAVRGRGVGRTMVLHSLEQARRAGFRGVQFNAVAASNVHAVRLYQELGFAVVGAVPGGFHHPQQGFVDLLIMYHQF